MNEQDNTKTENNEKPVTDSLTEACQCNDNSQQNDAEIPYSESYLRALNVCTIFEKKLKIKSSNTIYFYKS